MDDNMKLLTLNKVPVVYLNSVADFASWHLALRRLVKGYNMGDALLFSMPTNQVEAFLNKVKAEKPSSALGLAKPGAKAEKPEAKDDPQAKQAQTSKKTSAKSQRSPRKLHRNNKLLQKMPKKFQTSHWRAWKPSFLLT